MIAYYGHPDAARLLVEGIPLEDECDGCLDRHICLGWSPELSRNFGPVLEVDITGLPVEWELGEGRIHEPISAERVLRILPEPITPNWDGWEDPLYRTNHRECLRRGALRESEPAALSPEVEARLVAAADDPTNDRVQWWETDSPITKSSAVTEANPTPTERAEQSQHA